MRKIFLLLFSALAAWAQVSIEVGPEEVPLNEFVYVRIILDNPTSARMPGFPEGLETPDFKLRGRPTVSTSASFINGRSSSQKTLTYQFQPLKEGVFTFPVVKIQFDGKIYQSNPTRIKVGPERQQSIQRNRSLFDDTFGRRSGFSENPEVYATYAIPEKEFYLGEPIPLTINLLITPGLLINLGDSSMELPDFSEFWVEDIQASTQSEAVRYKDRTMERKIVAQKFLFPNAPGELKIQPTSFSLAVATGFGFSNRQQVTRKTEPLTVKVLPLPTKGKPADFSGIVGSYQLETELDKTHINADESVSLKITLKGSGNFSAINDFDLKHLEQDFEIFDGGAPTTESTNGVTHTKTWVYALVPKKEGTYEIPPLEINYFDHRAETYKKLKGTGYSLIVDKGQGLPGQPNKTGTALNFEGTQNLNFIKLSTLNPEKTTFNPMHPKRLMWLLGILATANLLVFLVVNLRERMQASRAGTRPKYAWKNFNKATKKLRSMSGKDQSKDYFTKLSQAIHDYFGDRWERAGKGLSLDYIHDRFTKDNVNLALYEELKEVIESCDLARFTPSTPASREQTLNKAVTTISKIDGVLP